MKQILLAVLGVVALVSVATTVLSQPAMPHGHGDPFAVIESLKGSLNLNTSQQQQWDIAVAQSQAARQSMRANLTQLRAGLQAELAKVEPDLASLAAQADAIQEQNIAARKAARGAWLDLYATFTPDQKTVVKNAIQARLARMESFRAQLKERLAQ